MTKGRTGYSPEHRLAGWEDTGSHANSRALIGEIPYGQAKGVPRYKKAFPQPVKAYLSLLTRARRNICELSELSELSSLLSIISLSL
jgi:hypothetical protein